MCMYLVDGYIDVFIAACEFVGLVWFGLVWLVVSETTLSGIITPITHVKSTINR